ncbi:MAG TPA: phage holin family protein [Rhizobacter sp.]
MHPLLHLVIREPNLLADHAGAYAELLGEEIGSASAQWKRKALLSAVALSCAGVGAVLVGVALMLWAVIPPENMNAPWALIVAPLVPLGAAVACWVSAQSQTGPRAFEQMRRQLREDAAMLKEVTAS